MSDSNIDKLTQVIKYIFLTIIFLGVSVLVTNIVELGNLLN